ncbi:uncharacterized protein LOC130814819 [Amaranthus tricolor]|uniref:uncharacterized protein LOC130814819 n=1 Tax=Amaranthus tricolor TaxID=29722 RepID=UPI00258F2F22|nr:uncharacterized protein LOC130814819 [Amaranthus tricolor]
MEDYASIKIKRKDLDEVNDDFSDFSLSAPARKIRRLDAESPHIIAEQEADFEVGYEHRLPESTMFNGSENRSKSVVIEELPSVPEDEKKAIVLFKPMNNNPFSQRNLSVDANFISNFINEGYWGNKLNFSRLVDEDESLENGNDNDKENACKAVIPWVPSQTLNPLPERLAPQTEVLESMDAEEMDVATMEIEDVNADVSNVGHEELSRLNEGLQLQQHQPYQQCQPYQQQHCLFPQPPQNTTTPVVWYR